MRYILKQMYQVLGLLFCLLITSCSGSGGGGVIIPASKPALGMNVVGLNNGQSFTVSVNYGSQSLTKTVDANGQIQLVQNVQPGVNYKATIPLQPQSDKCTITNNQGQIIDSSVIMQVVCNSNTYQLSGKVFGLEPGEIVTLIDLYQVTNMAIIDNNTSAAYQNTSFMLNESVPYLGSYNIQILTQPKNQTCAVDNNIGSMNGNISNINVNCNRSSYPVSVKYIGNKPINQNIVLVDRSNTLDMVSVNALHSTAQFQTLLPYGTGYDVRIHNQPSNYSCKFLNANSGNPINASSLPVVEISCTEKTNYSIGGRVTGMAPGEGITITSNKQVTNPNYTIMGNGAYTYPYSFALSESYNVSIYQQPKTQYCTLSNGTGILEGEVTNININCNYENGELAPLSPPTFHLSDSNFPEAMALTHDNKYAYVVDQSLNEVLMFKINTNGTLSSLAESTISTDTMPLSLAVSFDDKYVYVVNEGGGPNGLIVIYSINPDGTLTRLTEFFPFIATGINPRQISLTSDGKYAYVVNNTGSISMYNVESGGSNIVAMSPASIPTGSSPVSMAITSDNAHLYAVNQSDSTISMYNIASNGSLQAMEPGVVSTGAMPTSIIIAANNKFIYVANQSDHNVYIYNVGNNGFLDKISSVNINGNPFALSFSPDNKYLYVMTYSYTWPNNEVVSIFNVDNSTGQLTPLKYFPIEPLDVGLTYINTYNQMIAVSANNFVYILGNTHIYMYSIYNP